MAHGSIVQSIICMRHDGDLHFFDVFDNEARRVLLKLPIDGAGIGKDDPRTVHVAILGFGRMGRSLALRAAKIGHFANRKPLRISVIDRNGEQQRERFLFRHPILPKRKIRISKSETRNNPQIPKNLKD